MLGFYYTPRSYATQVIGLFPPIFCWRCMSVMGWVCVGQVVVRALKPGGQGELAGNIKVGDRVLSIQGVILR